MIIIKTSKLHNMHSNRQIMQINHFIDNDLFPLFETVWASIKSIPIIYHGLGVTGIGCNISLVFFSLQFL